MSRRIYSAVITTTPDMNSGWEGRREQIQSSADHQKGAIFQRQEDYSPRRSPGYAPREITNGGESCPMPFSLPILALLVQWKQHPDSFLLITLFVQRTVTLGERG